MYFKLELLRIVSWNTLFVPNLQTSEDSKITNWITMDNRDMRKRKKEKRKCNFCTLVTISSSLVMLLLKKNTWVAPQKSPHEGPLLCFLSSKFTRCIHLHSSSVLLLRSFLGSAKQIAVFSFRQIWQRLEPLL